MEKIKEWKKNKKMYEKEIQDIHDCLPESSKNNEMLRQDNIYFKGFVLGSLFGILFMYILAFISGVLK